MSISRQTHIEHVTSNSYASLLGENYLEFNPSPSVGVFSSKGETKELYKFLSSMKQKYVTSFLGPTFCVTRLSKPLVVYRAGEMGKFWSVNPPLSPWQQALDLGMHGSIYPEHMKQIPNYHPANKGVLVYEIPAGQIIATGACAPVGGFPGMCTQVYIQNVNEKMVKSLTWTQWVEHQRLHQLEVFSGQGVRVPRIIPIDYSGREGFWKNRNVKVQNPVSSSKLKIAVKSVAPITITAFFLGNIYHERKENPNGHYIYDAAWKFAIYSFWFGCASRIYRHAFLPMSVFSILPDTTLLSERIDCLLQKTLAEPKPPGFLQQVWQGVRHTNLMQQKLEIAAISNAQKGSQIMLSPFSFCAEKNIQIFQNAGIIGKPSEFIPKPPDKEWQELAKNPTAYLASRLNSPGSLFCGFNPVPPFFTNYADTSQMQAYTAAMAKPASQPSVPSVVINSRDAVVLSVAPHLSPQHAAHVSEMMETWRKDNYKGYTIPPPKYHNNDTPAWLKTLEITGSAGGAWVASIQMGLTWGTVGIGVAVLVAAEVFKYLYNDHKESVERKRLREDRRIAGQKGAAAEDLSTSNDSVKEMLDIGKNYFDENDPAKKQRLFIDFKHAIAQANKDNITVNANNDDRINHPHKTMYYKNSKGKEVGHPVKSKTARYCNDTIKPAIAENQNYINESQKIIDNHYAYYAGLYYEARVLDGLYQSDKALEKLNEILSDSPYDHPDRNEALKLSAYCRIDILNNKIEKSNNEFTSRCDLIIDDIVRNEKPLSEIFSLINSMKGEISGMKHDEQRYLPREKSLQRVIDSANFATLQEFHYLVSEGKQDQALILLEKSSLDQTMKYSIKGELDIYNKQERKRLMVDTVGQIASIANSAVTIFGEIKRIRQPAPFAPSIKTTSMLPVSLFADNKTGNTKRTEKIIVNMAGLPDILQPQKRNTP